MMMTTTRYCSLIVRMIASVKCLRQDDDDVDGDEERGEFIYLHVTLYFHPYESFSMSFLFQ